MPSVLSKIVKFCRKRLSEACLNGAMRRDGQACTKLLNLASALKKTGVSFRYDPNTKIYSYIGEGYGKPVHFFHKKRAIMYRKGIAARTSLLARDYFLSRIAFSDGDVVMDCGANIGELYLWFALNGLGIRYVAFEPSPLEFSALRLNCPDVEGHNVALWNRNETLTSGQLSRSAENSKGDGSKAT